MDTARCMMASLAEGSVDTECWCLPRALTPEQLFLTKHFLFVRSGALSGPSA